MSAELNFARFLIREADKIIVETYTTRIYQEGFNGKKEETFSQRCDRISRRAKKESIRDEKYMKRVARNARRN
jgi:hypothetical protein